MACRSFSLREQTVDTVTVRFERLRHCEQRKKSYWLTADGEDELQLPVELTTLSTVETPDGLMVDAVTVPEWIAVDRGLVDCETRRDDTRCEPQMSRQDWFTLGLTMAFLIRGETELEAGWKASKMAEKYVNGSRGIGD